MKLHFDVNQSKNYPQADHTLLPKLYKTPHYRLQDGSHGLQGIGAGFIPEVLNTDIIDETVTVTEEDAYEMGRIMGACEGVLVGISSGAALSAAVKTAALSENKGKTVVVLLPDTGDRYLSTPLFE